VAFDTDRNVTTGSSTLPKDPGMPFPGTDAVLTSWGTGASWSTWTGSAWNSSPLATKVDLAANQVTVSVPDCVAHPTGKWSATLATGLFDPTTQSWLPSPQAGNGKIYNLGFRFGPWDPKTDVASGQTLALTSQKPTTFAHILDFDLLRSGRARDDIPKTGLTYRVFASRLTTANYVKEVSPNDYRQFPAHEGKVIGPSGAQYLSRLQPYTLYVPATYQRSKPAPLTLFLHGQDDDYFGVSQNTTTQRGDQRGSIVLSVSGRGHRGWYMDEAEYDVFEAWNDVAQHYSLDPRRTAITGFSMGGYGTYRLALRYPQLFSRAVADAPALIRFRGPQGYHSGMWLPGVNDNTTLTTLIIDNARNLPIFHIADVASEATFYPAVALQTTGPSVLGAQSLDGLGYRYRLWSVAEDHVLATALDNFPEVRSFLGRNTVESPFRVTFTRVPAMDRPDLGLVSDQAYWVSHIVLRDAATPGPPRTLGGPGTPPRGHIDVISLGLGQTDGGSTVRRGTGATADGLPYTSQERTWTRAKRVPVQNRLVIRATNVRMLTIDPHAAHVTCSAKLDVTTDGPLTVRLAGCPGGAAHYPSSADATPGTRASGTGSSSARLAATGTGLALPTAALLLLISSAITAQRHGLAASRDEVPSSQDTRAGSARCSRVVDGLAALAAVRPSALGAELTAPA
jgi:pimeloyl-ACP methyl ester carboxylesterase